MKVKLGFLLAGWVMATSAVFAAENKDFAYQVKQGDILIVIAIATELLDSPSRWGEVAKYNGLQNPNLINPGKVLHIPYKWLRNLPAEAQVESVTGVATLNGQPLKPGDRVASGTRLATGKGGAVRVNLPDGSTLDLLENSDIEATQLTTKKQGGFFSAMFRLLSGRIDASKKKYPDGQAPLLIKAAHATLGVRGTRFRMGQEGEVTLAEIEHGLVGFEAGASTLALAGGQGSIADGIKAAAVVPLLPPPVFVDLPERFEQLLVRVNLAEMKGAQRFRGEVASDEGFVRIVAQAASEGTQLRIPDLADGIYWLRVRGVDARGLQGQEASTRFVLKAHPVPPMLMGPANNGKVRGEPPKFAWADVSEAGHYRVQLARDRQFKDLVVDHNALSAAFSPEQTVAVGEYFWRVASVKGDNDQGPWGDVRMLKVLPPTAPPQPPAFTKGRMTSSWEAEAGQTFEYQLAHDKDFTKPVLSLVLPAPKVDIAMPEPGKYFVRLRAIDADGYVGPWTPAQSFVTPGYEVGGCSNCVWGTP